MTSILSDWSASTYEHARQAVTSTVPPCANAQGSAKPPAPKMALMVLTTAAFSPESPPFASPGAAAAAAAEETTTAERRQVRLSNEE